MIKFFNPLSPLKMKNSPFLILIFFLLFAVNQSFSQSKKILQEQRKYLTSYESNTLAGNVLPVLMPYNKWVDPAGEQLYFGDKELENHALDCSLSLIHISEPTRLGMISYAVFCLKKK